MRAVHLVVPERELDERRQRGDDRWDEMWEGELHMPPAPTWDHQDVVTGLAAFLRSECGRRSLGIVTVQVAVHDPSDPARSYRIPDLTFVARGQESVIRAEGVVGPASVVIEIRSPDDESYEKLPFFARVGVLEVVIVDRDSRRPEVFRLAGRQYVAVAPTADGWVICEGLGIRLRHLAKPRRVRVEALDDPGLAVDL